MISANVRTEVYLLDGVGGSAELELLTNIRCLMP